MVADVKYINCRAIPDAELARFRRLALKAITETAPQFGEWVRKWCETEQFWRKTDPDHRPAKHGIALPPVADWSNKDLGKAVRAVTTLSYTPQHGSFSDFIDRIVMAICGEAADRLEKHA